MSFIHNYSETIISTLKVWGVQVSTSLFITLIDVKSLVQIIVTCITGGLSIAYTIWKWKNDIKDKK